MRHNLKDKVSYVSQPKTKEVAAANEAALLDQLLAGCEKPEDLLAPGGAFNRLKKRLIERLLGAELDAHLCYAKGQKAAAQDGSHRKGYSAKTVLGEDGPVNLEIDFVSFMLFRHAPIIGKF